MTHTTEEKTLIANRVSSILFIASMVASTLIVYLGGRFLYSILPTDPLAQGLFVPLVSIVAWSGLMTGYAYLSLKHLSPRFKRWINN